MRLLLGLPPSLLVFPPSHQRRVFLGRLFVAFGGVFCGLRFPLVAAFRGLPASLVAVGAFYLALAAHALVWLSGLSLSLSPLSVRFARGFEGGRSANHFRKSGLRGRRAPVF